MRYVKLQDFLLIENNFDPRARQAGENPTLGANYNVQIISQGPPGGIVRLGIDRYIITNLLMDGMHGGLIVFM